MNTLDLLKSLKDGTSLIAENFNFFQANSDWNLLNISVLLAAQGLRTSLIFIQKWDV